LRLVCSSATESLSERMGGLELQVTHATAAEGEATAQAHPSATTGPSSIADVSLTVSFIYSNRPDTAVQSK
jgi:hypothetical protein